MQLNSEKRKAAVKFKNSQKRNALSDLFKTLKQEGTSHLQFARIFTALYTCRVSVKQVSHTAREQNWVTVSAYLHSNIRTRNYPFNCT